MKFYKYISLYIFFFSYLFWYGLGFLHPQVALIQITYYTYFLIFLMPIMVLAGYFTPIRISFQNINYLNYQKSSRVFALTVLLIVIYLFFLYSSGMTRYHLIRVLVTFSIFYVCIFLLTKYFSLKVFSLLIISFFIVFLFLDLYTRRPLFSILFPFIYFLFLKQVANGINMKRIIKVIILSFLILTIFFLFTAYRINTIEELDLSSLFQAAIDIILFGSGFDTIYLTEYVVANFTFDNFLYGESFLAGLLNIVPRELWANKPIAFGITLSIMYFGISIDDIFTNFGPGIVAEAYANGGLIFVVFLSLFLGFILKVFDRWNSKSLFDFIRFGVSSIFLPSLFFLVRGDFVNSFYELYFKLIIFLLLTYVFRNYALR